MNKKQQDFEVNITGLDVRSGLVVTIKAPPNTSKMLKIVFNEENTVTVTHYGPVYDTPASQEAAAVDNTSIQSSLHEWQNSAPPLEIPASAPAPAQEEYTLAYVFPNAQDPDNMEETRVQTALHNSQRKRARVQESIATN